MCVRACECARGSVDKEVGADELRVPTPWTPFAVLLFLPHTYLVVVGVCICDSLHSFLDFQKF